ncbi:MAG: hypothetical protein KAR42_03140 [candidate division Zixibacteria bacterium]|nr:hypothetical protein [candidate division Zixibacteria bacterium]
MQIRLIVLLIIILSLFMFTTNSQADVSEKKAIKIAKKSIDKLTDQSYHYRAEYDSVFAITVHSRIIWKNDFYLVYFLNNNYFEAEVEVDKKTGEAVLLALKKMAQPYYDMHNGTFNYRYFDPDSVVINTKKRHSVEADSIRMVYFGVIPKLGKRGTIWEIFHADGIRYQSLGGASLTRSQIIQDLNMNNHRAGNFTKDEIRYDELNVELKRLVALTDEEKEALNLSQKKYDKYIKKIENEKKELLIRFIKLKGKDAKGKHKK